MLLAIIPVALLPPAAIRRGRIPWMQASSSLSLEQLNFRLREKWALLHDSADVSSLGGCRPEEWASRSLHATRLPNLPLSRCYLDDSKIVGAGRGVFASDDYPTGSLITLYPGDGAVRPNSPAAIDAIVSILRLQPLTPSFRFSQTASIFTLFRCCRSCSNSNRRHAHWLQSRLLLRRRLRRLAVPPRRRIAQPRASL